MHLKITFAIKTISHLFSPEDASFNLQSNLLVFPKGPASPRSAETADSPHSERTLAQRDPLFLGFPKSLPFSIFTPINHQHGESSWYHVDLRNLRKRSKNWTRDDQISGFQQDGMGPPRSATSASQPGGIRTGPPFGAWQFFGQHFRVETSQIRVPSDLTHR